MTNPVRGPTPWATIRGDNQLGRLPLRSFSLHQTIPMKPKPFQMNLALVLLLVLTPWGLSLWQDSVRFVMLQKCND